MSDSIRNLSVDEIDQVFGGATCLDCRLVEVCLNLNCGPAYVCMQVRCPS